MRPALWVRMPPPGDEFGGCYFMSGELTPDDDSWKPLYEHPPCAHCAQADDAGEMPADQIPGPAPVSMAEGE